MTDFTTTTNADNKTISAVTYSDRQGTIEVEYDTGLHDRIKCGTADPVDPKIIEMKEVIKTARKAAEAFGRLPDYVRGCWSKITMSKSCK